MGKQLERSAPQTTTSNSTTSNRSSQTTSGSGTGNAFLQDQMWASLNDDADLVCSEEGRTATVEEILGAGFDDMLLETEDRFFGSVASLDAMMGEILAQSAYDAEIIDDMAIEGSAQLDEVPAYVDELVETSCVEDEQVRYNTAVYDELYASLNDVELRLEVLGAEEEKWAVVTGLPALERFRDGVALWATMLAGWDARAQQVLVTAQELQALYDAHKTEYDEACMKMGLDTALLAAGVASTALLTGPAALAAGLTLTLTGVAGSLAIEGNLSDWGKTKAVVNGANLGAKGLELKGLVGELPSGLSKLGPALNVASLIMDGAEAVSERALAQQMQDKLRALMTESNDLLAAWPAIAACLDGTTKQLAIIENTMATEIPSIDSLDGQIDALLAQLAA